LPPLSPPPPPSQDLRSSAQRLRGHQARLRRSLGAGLHRPQQPRGHPERLPQSPGAAPGRPRTRPPPGPAPGQAACCSTPRSHPPSRHAPPKTQHTNSANPHIAHIQQTPNKRQTLPEPSPSRPAPGPPRDLADPTSDRRWLRQIPSLWGPQPCRYLAQNLHQLGRRPQSAGTLRRERVHRPLAGDQGGIRHKPLHDSGECLQLLLNPLQAAKSGLSVRHFEVIGLRALLMV
jgi:hypothetical protein